MALSKCGGRLADLGFQDTLSFTDPPIGWSFLLGWFRSITNQSNKGLKSQVIQYALQVPFLEQTLFQASGQFAFKKAAPARYDLGMEPSTSTVPLQAAGFLAVQWCFQALQDVQPPSCTYIIQMELSNLFESPFDTKLHSCERKSTTEGPLLRLPAVCPSASFRRDSRRRPCAAPLWEPRHTMWVVV